jgi:hypothetical protein
MQEIYKI